MGSISLHYTTEMQRIRQLELLALRWVSLCEATDCLNVTTFETLLSQLQLRDVAEFSDAISGMAEVVSVPL